MSLLSGVYPLVEISTAALSGFPPTIARRFTIIESKTGTVNSCWIPLVA
jgi:hypothetical protein